MLIGLVSGVLLLLAVTLILRVIWERTHAPIRPMTAPSSTPFLRRYARQAARQRRRVWIKYREPHGELIERTVEIYQTTLTGHISGWCRAQRSRCTFRRDRILAWQLLNEPFKRSDGMVRRHGRMVTVARVVRASAGIPRTGPRTLASCASPVWDRLAKRAF